ncbi:hypothetical protein AX16_010907 [Volvariella volvacea WC 439]|nr:hypothetical protein AX16_010907 [Volvariella volvacea WC 439]
MLREWGLSNDDGAAFDSLYPPNLADRRTLADIIFSKLGTSGPSDMPSASRQRSDPAFGLDPRVVAMFEKVGESLRGTGQLHKSIKALPSFPQWKRFLALTHPEDWSPFMMRKITNAFMSTMNPAQAQFFLRHVLLPAVREDIASRNPASRYSNRRLNVHLYEALLKALYKPAPFFKAVLFPILDEGCTLKEAVIFASVLAKKSIPAVHMGAVLLRLAEQDFSGPRALIIRVLLDKKKDLPFKVLDSLVFHFIRISNTHTKGELPVLWHQSLLVLVQRYAPYLTDDQHNSLLDVARVHFHKDIGPEIRRELALCSTRDAMQE